MAKVSVANIGPGGRGFQGNSLTSAFAVLRELQGLNLSLVTGGTANTKFDLAAIRSEDTIISAINNNAGTLTDITADVTIAATKATGTVTAASVTAGDTVSVNGITYTAIANTATKTSYKQFFLGANNNATATNIAAAVNAGESAASTKKLDAVAASAVVTFTARADGTAGNAITLTSSNGTRLAVTGSGTLTGGTATGGIASTSATNQIVLLWLNKR